MTSTSTISRIERTLPYEFEVALVSGRGAGSIYQEVYRLSYIQQTAERWLCGLFLKYYLLRAVHFSRTIKGGNGSCLVLPSTKTHLLFLNLLIREEEVSDFLERVLVDIR